jgi:hypothetical protein
MRNKLSKKKKVVRGDFMSPIESIEKDREIYYQDLKAYYEKIKRMPKTAAVKLAKNNLKQAGIIDDEGILTDRYKNSR